MRRLFIYIIIFIIFIVPFNVSAVEIKGVSITGDSYQKIGNEITIKFKIDVDSLPAGFDNTKGIWIIGYTLDFDSDVLLPSEIQSPYFDSGIYLLDNQYYVLSEVIDNDHEQVMCANGALYCGDYEVALKFYIKDTTKNITTISISDVSIGLLDIVDDEKEYTLEDVIEVNNSVKKTHNINIIKTAITSNTTQQMVVPKVNKRSNITKNTKTSHTTSKNSHKQTSRDNTKSKTNTKSSNNYLKSLEIKDHEIDFNKYQNEYEVNISNQVNSLGIKLSLEDKKAKYKVIGANDLKSNNYQVNIEVMSEDGKKNVYTIKTKVKKVEEVLTNEEKPKEKVDKRFLIYGGIGLGMLFLIVIIIFIISKIKDRKINKLLDEI